MPAIAVGQPTSIPAMPPPSQPRQGSTAPTLILRDWRIAFHCHRRMHTALNVRRSNVGAGLPAIAAGQPASIPAMPPPSQPRRGSTAPTLIFRVWKIAFHCHRRMHTALNVLKIQCRSWLASDSGGSANINPSNAAAIAASPRLDSSYIDRLHFSCHRRMHTVLNVRRSKPAPRFFTESSLGVSGTRGHRRSTAPARSCSPNPGRPGKPPAPPHPPAFLHGPGQSHPRTSCTSPPLARR